MRDTDVKDIDVRDMNVRNTGLSDKDRTPRRTYRQAQGILTMCRLTRFQDFCWRKLLPEDGAVRYLNSYP